jgi:hypothetical protein
MSRGASREEGPKCAAAAGAGNTVAGVDATFPGNCMFYFYARILFFMVKERAFAFFFMEQFQRLYGVGAVSLLGGFPRVSHGNKDTSMHFQVQIFTLQITRLLLQRGTYQAHFYSAKFGNLGMWLSSVYWRQVSH